MSNPWFRMYVDFLTDTKMISLAFEDQRHFIGILALKCAGVLDQECNDLMMNRIVSQRLWIDHSIIADVKKRLIDSGLIDEKWHPLAWDKRQYKSDRNITGAERARNYRERQRTGFDRLMEEQNWRCGCCEEPFKVPYNKYVVMDHDHKTKENRALVCQSCNRVIGQIENGEHCVSEKKEIAESYITKHSVTLRNVTVTLPDTDTEEETETDKPKTPLPEWLPKELLDDFKLHRKTLKSPMTERSIKIFIREVTKLKDQGYDPIECIETAMLNGWKSVYAPKTLPTPSRNDEWVTK